MFDRYESRTESKVVAVTKEIEKTISPDKVTEMYDKIRAEVEHDIIKTHVINTNIIKGMVIEVADRYETRTKKVYTAFNLNEDYHVSFTVEDIDRPITEQGSFDRVSEMFFNAVKNKILGMLITEKKLK